MAAPKMNVVRAGPPERDAKTATWIPADDLGHSAPRGVPPRERFGGFTVGADRSEGAGGWNDGAAVRFGVCKAETGVGRYSSASLGRSGASP
jgi:hypothetical protein